MSIIVGVHDFTPDEMAEKIRACKSAGHELQLFTLGEALHTNQSWQGRAIGVGCEACGFVQYASLTAEDEIALRSALETK
jgi:hypothetical protein